MRGIDANFKLEYKIENNRFWMEIVSNSDEEHYAFYLIKNGEVINRKWYSCDKKVSFLLTDDGEYSGVGFVKKNEKILNQQTPKILYEHTGEKYKEIHISIFGSCVSRDLIEYDESRSLILDEYIARQSIISALSEPLHIDENKINLTSNFQKNQIIGDFRKDAFIRLADAKSEYLLIDLIDERFHLALLDGSVVTFSNELQQSGLQDVLNLQQKKVGKIGNWKILKRGKGFKGYSFYFNEELLEEYVKQFCEKIKEIYTEDKIIIHRALMLNQYINKENKIMNFPLHYLLYNKMINERLNYMYDYFEKYLPKAYVIDECEHFYADERHKWGLGPMHYQKEYYIKVVEQIKMKGMSK